MDNLNLEEFSPKKAELTALVEKYKDLTIAGPDDEEGYQIMKKAKRHLGTKRKDVKEAGMSLRREAIDFQTSVINKEKELLGITSPEEDRMTKELKGYDEAKLKKERRIQLPTRKEMLGEIDVDLSDDDILAMSTEEFREFFNTNKDEYLSKKEVKIKEDEEKLAEEKRLEEARKEARIEAEKQAALDTAKKAEEAKEAEEKRAIKAKEDAEADRIKVQEDKIAATRESRKLRMSSLGLVYSIEHKSFVKDDINIHENELISPDEEFEKIFTELETEVKKRAAKKVEDDKAEAVKAAEDKAETDKQAVIDAAAKKEADRIADEKVKAEVEADAKKKQESEAKYKEWLEENGYNDDPTNYYIAHQGDVMVLYKLISKFNPKQNG